MKPIFLNEKLDRAEKRAQRDKQLCFELADQFNFFQNLGFKILLNTLDIFALDVIEHELNVVYGKKLPNLRVLDCQMK